MLKMGLPKNSKNDCLPYIVGAALGRVWRRARLTYIYLVGWARGGARRGRRAVGTVRARSERLVAVSVSASVSVPVSIDRSRDDPSDCIRPLRFSIGPRRVPRGLGAAIDSAAASPRRRTENLRDRLALVSLDRTIGPLVLLSID